MDSTNNKKKKRGIQKMDTLGEPLIPLSKRRIDKYDKKIRHHDKINSILVGVNIVLATIAYESSWEMGDQGAISVKWKSVLLIVSIINFFVAWKKHTYLRSVTDPDKPLWHSTEFVVDIALLSLVPVPGFNVEIFVPKSRGVELFSTYQLSEILYGLMFLRLYFPFKYFIRYYGQEPSMNMPSAYYTCKKNDVSYEVLNIKCFIRDHLPQTIITLLVLTFLVFGQVLKVFERRTAIEERENGSSENNLDKTIEAMWCIFVSITTVGYGDVYPITWIGRLVCMCAVFWGFVIIGVLLNSGFEKGLFGFGEQENFVLVELRRNYEEQQGLGDMYVPKEFSSDKDELLHVLKIIEKDLSYVKSKLKDM